MAACIFLDFDAGLQGAAGVGPTLWSNLAKPPGLFVYDGVLGQDQAASHPAPADVFESGRTSGSTAWGTSSAVINLNNCQIAIKRSVHGIGTELWCSADVGFPANGGFGNLNTDTRKALFRFGDITVFIKSSTLIVATYTIVYTIKNNGVEIATITVPNIVDGSWSFFKMACKLDATTGYITCTVDGVNMSSSYTGQNTVQVISAASTGTRESADHVYFGLPARTNGAGGWQTGKIDNIYIDDASHPTGRPRGERVSLGTSSTDVSAAAVGTGATTIADALANPTDAKAARFTGAAASSIIDLASYSTSGLETNLIGFNLYMKRPASRDPNVARFIAQGLDISGVQTMGTNAVGITLPVSSVTVPPNTDYPIHGLFDKIYTAGVTTANLANVKIRLLTS